MRFSRSSNSLKRTAMTLSGHGVDHPACAGARRP
jgi:hypothetical protein